MPDCKRIRDLVLNEVRPTQMLCLIVKEYDISLPTYTHSRKYKNNIRCTIIGQTFECVSFVYTNISITSICVTAKIKNNLSYIIVISM